MTTCKDHQRCEQFSRTSMDCPNAASCRGPARGGKVRDALLVGFFAIIWLGSWITQGLLQAEREHDAVLAVRQLGGRVMYSWRFDKFIHPSVRFTRLSGWLFPGDLRIQLVNLSGCQDGSLDQKLACLRSIDGLRWLNLSYAQLGDAGIRHLEGQRNLEWLNLRNTLITNAALRSIVPLTQLQALDLANTRVSDAGLPYLVQMKQLKQLDLQGTQVTWEGVEELKEYLPSARIRTEFEDLTASAYPHEPPRPATRPEGAAYRPQ